MHHGKRRGRQVFLARDCFDFSCIDRRAPFPPSPASARRVSVRISGVCRRDSDVGVQAGTFLYTLCSAGDGYHIHCFACYYIKRRFIACSFFMLCLRSIAEPSRCIHNATRHGRWRQYRLFWIFFRKKLSWRIRAHPLLSFHEMLYSAGRRTISVIVAVIAVYLLLGNSKTALALSFLAPLLAVLTLILRRTTRISPVVLPLTIVFSSFLTSVTNFTAYRLHTFFLASRLLPAER